MLQCRKDKDKLRRYLEENRERLDQFDSVEMMAAMMLLGEQKRVEKMIERKENGEENAKDRQKSTV